MPLRPPGCVPACAPHQRRWPHGNRARRHRIVPHRRCRSRARALAEQLDALNRERQQVESEVVDAILKQCEDEMIIDDYAAMVFSGPAWHLGVLGIVASRLVERFSRPVFVLSDASALGRNRGAEPFRLRPQHPRLSLARGA